MPIKPKHNITGENNIPSAERQFTDREEYTEAFKKKIKFESKQDYNILSYYGVGGIGKSTLKKELGRILSTAYSEIIWSSTDFELQAFREAETSLYHLRKNLREKYKIEFPTFDIAYTIYWQKTHPQVTIAKDNIPFLEDGTIVSDILSHTGAIPIVGLLPSIAKAVYKGQKYFKNWWTKRGQKELYDLPSLNPKEILERLPMYFSLDLKDYLQINSKNAVIFVDTYEALWENFNLEGGFFLRDEWLRELITHLPSVLWVIFGREKLRWNELDNEWESYIEQHLLGGLSEQDSAGFLRSCGITDEKIQNVIINSSKGVPYYLDLAVDTYLQIKQKYNREPEEKDFAKNQQEVLARFLRYLDKNEIETLKILSVPRYWNREIFKLLIDEFKTGYPVSAMNVLGRFSFVNSVDQTDTYVLHDLMRQGLMLQLDKETKTGIEKLLFEHFCVKITGISEKDISDEHCNAFNEAFYHGKAFLKAGELQKWFSAACSPFNEAAKWMMLSTQYEELLNIIETTIGKNTVEFASTVTYFSSVLYNLGEYKRALDLIENNFTDLKNTLGENENRYSSLLNNLATIYYYRGESLKSKEMYLQVLKLRRKNLGENHRHYADVIDNLAVIYSDTGEYDKAIELHKKAAEIYKNVLGEGHVHYADALNNLASVYQKQKKYDEAIELFDKALKIVIKSVGENHPRYASGLNNFARVYFEKGEAEQALLNHQKAYELRVKLLGENHPWTAHTLSNMSEVYYKTGELEKSIELQEKAMRIFKNTVGEKHFHFADSVKYLGECYEAQGKLDKALEYFKQAVDLYTQIYGQDNNETIGTLKRIEELNKRANSSF
jgi:tetratricopeptide (TPR) repeat protein